MWLSLEPLQAAVSYSSAPSSELYEYMMLAALLSLLNVSGFVATYRFISKGLVSKSAVKVTSLIGILVIIILVFLVMAFIFFALIGAGGRLGAMYYFLFAIGRFMAVSSSVVCWIWWGSLFLQRSDSIEGTT